MSPLYDLDKLVDLETEIIQYDDHLRRYPDDTKTEGKLKRRLSKWVDNLEIIIFVASNEQKPWKDVELGYPTKPMPTKAMIGRDQVGDYQCYIDRGGRMQDNFASFVVDRKTCEDFYGTLFSKNGNGEKNRQRFYRELDRYYKDPRFDQFHIFVECDLLAWLNYVPPNNPGTDLMINQKTNSVQSLEVRGAHVHWCHNRKTAVKLYRDLVRQWCLQNYRKIIIGSGTVECERVMQPRVVEELGFV